jgi:subtilisin family serine protease
MKDDGGNYYWSGGLTQNSDQENSLSTNVTDGAIGNFSWVITDYGIDKIWTQTKGAGVKVAVIDTGLNYNQPNIAGKTNIEYYNIFTGASNREGCLDVDGHGTACAGVISALGPDVFGIAPEADLLIIKATVNGSMACKDMATAINEAIKLNANIISVSYEIFDKDPDLNLLDAAIKNATDSNVLVVSSTGNAGHSLLFPLPGIYPASYQNSIGVGASDENKNFWDGTTLCINIDILAPGVAISLLGLDNRQPLTGTGTSYAAPYVAGVCALLMSMSRDQSLENLTGSLKQASTNKQSIAAQIQQFFGNPNLTIPNLGVINPIVNLNPVTDINQTA